MIQIFLMFLVLSPVFGASLSLVRLGNQIGTMGAFESMVTAEMLRRLASDEVRYAEWANLMTSGQWLETPPLRDELNGIADEIDRQCADVLRVRYDNAGVIQRLLFASGGIELGFPEKMSDYSLAGRNPTNDDSYVFQGPERAPLKVNVTPKEFRGTLEFTEAGTLAEIRKPMLVFALGLSSLIACLLWDTIFRSGWTAWFSGIRYVDRRGRKAGIGRFAFRSIVLWSPFLAISSIVIAMDIWYPDYSWLTGNLFSVLLISPLIMMLVTMLSLRRGFHDYASGVYPVAK